MTDLERLRAAAMTYHLLRRRGVPVEDAMRQAWAAFFGSNQDEAA